MVSKSRRQKGKKSSTRGRSEPWPPLLIAAYDGDLATVSRLVSEGVAVDRKDNEEIGTTALMQASSRGHIDVVKHLVEKGADVNARDDALGQTALMFAAGSGHLQIVQFLVANGADPTAMDRDGMTALLWASTGRFRAIEKYLRRAAIGKSGSAIGTEGQRCNSCGHFVPLAKTPPRIFVTACPRCGGEVAYVQSLFGRLFGSYSLLRRPFASLAARVRQARTRRAATQKESASTTTPLASILKGETSGVLHSTVRVVEASGETRVERTTYAVSKSQVITKDVRTARALVSDWQSQLLTRRATPGGFQLGISGYDTDPRELYQVPEVRAWFTELSQSLPYIPLALSDESLRMYLLCVLDLKSVQATTREPGSAELAAIVLGATKAGLDTPHIQALVDSRRHQYLIAVDPAGFRRFLEASLPQLFAFLEESGLSETEAREFTVNTGVRMYHAAGIDPKTQQ